MQKLTVIVHTKNADKTLQTCLNSVKFANEIICIDMNSTDQTIKIINQFTDKIFLVDDKGFADPVRNFGLSKASNTWILVVDADEEIPCSLQEKIITLINKPADQNSVSAYYLPRKNLVFNSWIEHTGWWPDYQVRLFKKGTVSWSDKVHCLPLVEGQIEKLPAIEKFAIIHHNYPTVESFLERLNRYTSIKAKELFKSNKALKIDQSTLINNFFTEYFNRYFANQGFKDKGQGMGLALLQSMYELTVKLKYWQYQNFDNQHQKPIIEHQNFRQIISDFNYWLANDRVAQTQGLSQLFWKFRRKLRI